MTRTTDQPVAGFFADEASTQRQASRALRTVETAVEDAKRAVACIRRDLDELDGQLDLESVNSTFRVARTWTHHAGYSGTLEAQAAEIRAALATITATTQAVIQ